MTPVLDAVRREELRKLIEAMPDWVRRRWSVVDVGRNRGSVMVACAADTLLSLHRRAYPRSEEVAIGAYIAAVSPDTALALLAERDGFLAYIAELEAGLASAVKLADEAVDEWDKAPSGMRAGKILLALAGRIPGYRTDTDAIVALLLKATPFPRLTSEGDAPPTEGDYPAVDSDGKSVQ